MNRFRFHPFTWLRYPAFSEWSSLEAIHCHCGIQKDCLLIPEKPYSRTLAEMQVELIAPVLSHHVPQRCTFIRTPPSQIFQDWKAHRPDLLWGSNPSPRLTIWTRPTCFQFYIALFQFLFPACYVVLCCYKYAHMFQKLSSKTSIFQIFFAVFV